MISLNSFTKIPYKNKVIVTDGMIGGGKTLIANLISSLKNVDPWIYDSNVERFCALNKLKKITKSTSSELIRKNYNEKYFDSFILRHLNFRKKDQSSIYNYPRYKDIIKRQMLSDEQAEKKIKNSKHVLQFMTHTLVNYSEPIFYAYGKQLLFVLILRNPFNIYTINWVAKWTEIFKKSDSRDGRINYYSKKFNQHVPFEIEPKNIEYYCKLNKYEKAIYLINIYYKNSLKNLKNLKKNI